MLRCRAVAGDLILGLDVGGSKTAVVVGNRAGEVRKRWAFPSAVERGFEAMWQEAHQFLLHWICDRVEDAFPPV